MNSKRKEKLAALKATPKTERIENGVKIIEDPEKARIQLVFDGKPIDLIRDELKRWGFRWAPSEGAWQRNLNESRKYAARKVMEAIGGLL